MPQKKLDGLPDPLEQPIPDSLGVLGISIELLSEGPVLEISPKSDKHCVEDEGWTGIQRPVPATPA